MDIKEAWRDEHPNDMSDQDANLCYWQLPKLIEEREHRHVGNTRVSSQMV